MLPVRRSTWFSRISYISVGYRAPPPLSRNIRILWGVNFLVRLPSLHALLFFLPQTWSEGSFGSEGGAPDAASDGEGERKREDDVSVGKGGSEGGGGEFFMKTLHRLVGGKGDDAGDDSGDWDWD